MGGDGIGPMAGPAYQFSQNSRSRFKWPRYYHGVPLFYEWTRDYIKEFRLDRPNGTRLEEIRHVPAFVDNPMDMEFGPDGALYVLEYGTGSSRRTRTPSSPGSTSCAATTHRFRRSRPSRPPVWPR